MANSLYVKGKEKILQGLINFPAATIKAALVSNSYAPNLSTDEFWDIPEAYLLNTPQTLFNKAVTGGAFDADDINFTAVTQGSTAKAVVIYLDSGVSNTSPLICYLDTIAGFPLATNGGDVTIQWDNGALKIFSL